MPDPQVASRESASVPSPLRAWRGAASPKGRQATGLRVDPPGYRYTASTIWNCQFCAHERDVRGWAVCAKYGCMIHLNSLCEGFEARGERERPFPTPEETERLGGPWMRLPTREIPGPPEDGPDEDDWPWRRQGAKRMAGYRRR